MPTARARAAWPAGRVGRWGRGWVRWGMARRGEAGQLRGCCTAGPDAHCWMQQNAWQEGRRGDTQQERHAGNPEALPPPRASCTARCLHGPCRTHAWQGPARPLFPSSHVINDIDRSPAGRQRGGGGPRHWQRAPPAAVGHRPHALRLVVGGLRQGGGGQVKPRGRLASGWKGSSHQPARCAGLRPDAAPPRCSAPLYSGTAKVCKGRTSSEAPSSTVGRSPRAASCVPLRAPTVLTWYMRVDTIWRRG